MEGRTLSVLQGRPEGTHCSPAISRAQCVRGTLLAATAHNPRLAPASDPHSPLRTIQQAAEEEQRRVIAEHGTDITFDVLNELDTLHNCIQEALRLQPPLVLLMRYAKEPFEVTTSDGRSYVVPKVRWLWARGVAASGRSRWPSQEPAAVQRVTHPPVLCPSQPRAPPHIARSLPFLCASTGGHCGHLP